MPRTLLLFLSVASAGLCTHAEAAHWSVCNHTPESLNVAIAYHNQNQTITEGWRVIGPCGPCVVMLNYDSTDNDTVYLFAKNDHNVPRFAAEHPRLCVANQAFRLQNGPGGHCSIPAVGFQKVTIRDWDRNHVTTLEGACTDLPGQR